MCNEYVRFVQNCERNLGSQKVRAYWCMKSGRTGYLNKNLGSKKLGTGTLYCVCRVSPFYTKDIKDIKDTYGSSPIIKKAYSKIFIKKFSWQLVPPAFLINQTFNKK
jgi:hypothetical protein